MITELRLNQKHRDSLSFTAGKTSLYTDFDGTFLADTLYDVYNGSAEDKKSKIGAFNKYFKDFQNLIDASKDKFEIIITTGRRLGNSVQEGFQETFQFMKNNSIQLPKIKALITTEGGDIHSFSPDGSITQVPDKEKSKLIKEMCGWDKYEISKSLDEISQKTPFNYSFENNRGSYKLSIQISDESKLDSVHQELQNSLKSKMQFTSRIANIKVYENDNASSYKEVRGIRMEPLINGQKIHKDFDVRIALKNAVKNNDFVVVAGDADNDKEMLNIFSYIGMDHKPKRAGDITPEVLQHTKSDIDKLPIKILFIKPMLEELALYDDPDKIKQLYEFMQEQQKFFPDKVQIVDKTNVGVNNNFLKAVKNGITVFSRQNEAFYNGIKDNPAYLKELGFDVPAKINKNRHLWPIVAISGGAIGLVSIGMSLKKRTSSKDAIVVGDNKLSQSVNYMRFKQK